MERRPVSAPPTAEYHNSMSLLEGSPAEVSILFLNFIPIYKIGFVWWTKKKPTKQ